MVSQQLIAWQKSDETEMLLLSLCCYVYANQFLLVSSGTFQLVF